MIYTIFEILASICLITLFISGLIFLLYWAKEEVSDIKEFTLFKKRYKWICEHCGDIVKSKTRPYCKPCCHIHRHNVKMFKIYD